MVDGKIRSYGHDVAGEPLAREFLAGVGLSQYASDVVPMVGNHMRVRFAVRDKSASGFRRVSLRVRDMSLLKLLVSSDVTGRELERGSSFQKEHADVEARFEGMLREVGSKVVPLVQGRHLMSLGVPPGPRMGEMLKVLLEMQVQGVFADVAGGLRKAEELL
jgi:tRNA nucleotidyltransferase (CCA-adding enzyme)